MSVLMVDVGGTSIKLMNSPLGQMRYTKSGPQLTGLEMIEKVRSQTSDWNYESISLGYPGLLKRGRPERDPLNLGPGWIDIDYESEFGKPVRIINDAAMQALGNYTEGSLLFLSLGTSIGSSLIVDDTILSFESGMIKFTESERFLNRLSNHALERDGVQEWTKSVIEAVSLLQDMFHPDETILGGGNAKIIRPLSLSCRTVGNDSAYLGAMRLWENDDLYVQPRERSWRIIRKEARL